MLAKHQQLPTLSTETINIAENCTNWDLRIVERDTNKVDFWLQQGGNKDESSHLSLIYCISWLLFSVFFLQKEERNKWLLSPNIPVWTSKCVMLSRFPVTSNDSHKWVAKVPKAKLLKATVAVNCRLVVADRIVKSNNACFLLRRMWWGIKKKMFRHWMHHINFASPQRPTKDNLR